MPTVVYILGTIFLGIIGITYVDNYMKIQKARFDSSKKQGDDSLKKELDLLKKENLDLRKRIENLEAIIVDDDMRLMTGIDLHPDEDQFAEERKSQTNQNLETE